MADRHPLLEPRISIDVANSNTGIFRTVEVTVDTAFTSWLTLPQSIIRELGLQYRGTRRVILADGSRPETHLYLAFISWRGNTLPRLVHQSDSNPLLGMGLLAGSKLTVEAVAGGNVVIEEI